MSKKDAEGKTQDQSRDPGESEFSDTLRRFHGYVMKGKKMDDDDRFWLGIIRINKDCRITITDKKNKARVVIVPGNVQYKANAVVLSQLVLKATQEGPPGKIYDWDATGFPNSKNPAGIPQHVIGFFSAEDPLEIEILRENSDQYDPIRAGESEPAIDSDRRREIASKKQGAKPDGVPSGSPV